MAKVLFKRYETDAEAQASNIVDGQFIVTKEGTSYTDYGTDRIAFGGTLDTQMSDSSINGVQNKVIKEYVDDGVQEAKDYSDSNLQEAKDYVDEKHTYSTTETIIGTYNDKPLYRKIVTGTLPSLSPSSGGVADGNVAHGISNIDKVIFITGTLTYSNVPLQFPVISSSGKLTGIRTVNNTNIVIRSSDGWQAGPSLEFTIEYTKTTD